MAVGGINKWTPSWKTGGISRVSPRFSLNGENEQADAIIDGTAGHVSRSQILRRERGQENKHVPRWANDKQDWQPYPVAPYSTLSYGHKAK